MASIVVLILLLYLLWYLLNTTPMEFVNNFPAITLSIIVIWIAIVVWNHNNYIKLFEKRNVELKGLTYNSSLDNFLKDEYPRWCSSQDKATCQ
jgi:hypothetical protein